MSKLTDFYTHKPLLHITKCQTLCDVTLPSTKNNRLSPIYTNLFLYTHLIFLSSHSLNSKKGECWGSVWGSVCQTPTPALFLCTKAFQSILGECWTVSDENTLQANRDYGLMLTILRFCSYSGSSQGKSIPTRRKWQADL